MRKIAIVLGLLCLLCTVVAAQTVTFKKIIVDGSGNVGWSVIEEPDGYIAIGAGWDNPRTMIQTKLFKTDLYGNVVSSKMYGTTGQFTYPGGAGSVYRTNDGHFILGGSIEYSGTSDGLLLKFDKYLDTLWSSRFSQTAYDLFYKVHQTPDLGFIMIGSSRSINNDVQASLVKTDSIGQLMWFKLYGGQYRDVGRGLAEKPNGGYLLAGDKYLDNTFNKRKGYLLNVDDTGVLVKDTIIGTLGDDGPSYLSRLSDSTYIIFGALDTISNDLTPYYAQLNKDFGFDWFNVISTAHERDFIWQARPLSDGSVLLGGERKVMNETYEAVWLMKVNTFGELIWERMHVFDETKGNITWLRDFQETTDRGFIITGMAMTRDDSTNAFVQNFLLMKLDSLGCLDGDCGLLTDVPETQKQPIELSVFPNPAKESFTIKYALPYGLHNNPQVVLYNLQGKQVYQALLYKAKDVLKVPTADLGSGMYIYQLVSGGKVLGSGKGVVE